MRVIFIGPPGAGKGTQAVRLVRHLNLPHISTGEILRAAAAKGTPEGLLADKYIKQGALVPDSVIIEIVGQRLGEGDCDRGCLLDGFPRTLDQAVALDAFLDERGRPVDGVIELAVDEELLFNRLVGRGRDDDKPEVIRERFRTYRNQTEPLLDYYRRRGMLETIDGEGPPDVVFERIKHAVDRIRKRGKRDPLGAS